jgi:hypothetical protein
MPPSPLSRARSLGISLAGPFVGLLVGVALYALRRGLGGRLDPFGWQDQALAIGVWTCIGWSLLNLLPILPLDGGQAMRELLPGAAPVRARRAGVVSVVVAAAAALVAYAVLQQTFLAVFLVFFAVTNVLTLRQTAAPGAGGSSAQPQAPSAEQAVVALLWRNEPGQARDLLASLPPDTPVDLAVHGAVLALTGDPAQGHALLAQEVQRRPGDPNAVALLVLTLTLQHDWDGVVGALQGPLAGTIPATVVERAVEEARGTGREDVAGRITLLATPPGSAGDAADASEGPGPWR